MMEGIEDPRHSKDAAWLAFDIWRGIPRAKCRTGSPYEWQVLTPSALRMCICSEQNWRCCYCGVRMFAGEPMECAMAYCVANRLPSSNPKKVAKLLRWRLATVEHLLRRCDGGGNERGNLASACGWCNSNRQDRTSTDWWQEVQELIADDLHPHGLLAQW